MNLSLENEIHLFACRAATQLVGDLRRRQYIYGHSPCKRRLLYTGNKIISLIIIVHVWLSIVKVKETYLNCIREACTVDYT